MNNKNSDIDNIFDDLDFKPITDGLGFHHSLKEKASVEVNMKSQQASLETDMVNRVKSLQAESKSMEKPLHMGELSAFYDVTNEESEVSDLIIGENSAESVQTSLMSPLHYRFFAWLIDISLLLTVMVFTIASILVFAELPLETLNLFMLSDELQVSFISIFGMFYLFYFTLLDMTRFSTLGKKIIGIKVESTQARVSIVQTFLRALITMMSIPLIGLPALLRIDNMLTRSYVSNR